MVPHSLGGRYRVRRSPSGQAGFPSSGGEACARGSKNITSVSGANWGNQTIVGDGVTFMGCGAANRMSTPSELTVTPSGTWGLAGTESPVTVANGASTYSYSYTVIARDQNGGLTLPEVPVTITTGLSSLGLQTATIANITRTNDQITVTTTASTTLVAGELVQIIVTNAPEFYGWYNVGHVTSGTQFEIFSTSVDTRAAGWMNGDVSSYTGGGSISYYRMNFLKWAPVTGAWDYFICGKRPSDTNYHLIGVTKPSNAGYIDASFEDYGSPYEDLQKYPIYLQTAAEEAFNNNATNIAAHTRSNAACTAGSAKNDYFSSWIVSSPDNGSTLVMNDAAGSNGRGTPGYWDDAPGFRRALAAAAYQSPNYFGGSIYIPPALNTYMINSTLSVPVDVTILQSGKLNLNETVILSSGVNWFGDFASEGTPQFGIASGASVYPIAAVPGVYANGTGITMRHLSISPNVVLNGAVAMVSDVGPVSIDKVNFGTGGAATDYSGTTFITRGTGSIEQVFINDSSFTCGPDQVNDKSWTPCFWIAPGLNGANVGIEVVLRNTMWNRRGIAAGGGGSTGSYGNNTGTCSLASFTSYYSYRQGGITPMLADMQCPPNALATFYDASQDTEGQPLLTNLFRNPSAMLIGMRLFGRNVAGGARNAIVTGVRPAGTDVTGPFLTARSIPNRDLLYDSSGYLNMLVAPFNTTGSYAPSLSSLRSVAMPMHGAGGYSWWFDAFPPTGVTAATTSGGSVPSGTWRYAVSGVGADSGETIMSPAAADVTTSRGTQTVKVSWSPLLGMTSYNVWRSNAPSRMNADGSLNVSSTWYRVALHVAGTSYSDTSAAPTQYIAQAASGTGPTVLNKNMVAAPLFLCPERTAPTGIAGFDTFYCDSTTHGLKEIPGTGSAVPISEIIASGSATMGTSLIASGACATTVTAVATGALATDNLSADFNSDPSGMTGYGVNTRGFLTIYKWITPDQVNFRVCNSTAGGITPSAATLQWRVIR